MKLLILIPAVLMMASVLYANIEPNFYVVINADNSIHTVARNKDDVLYLGQKRFPIYTQSLPNDFDNKYYYWGDDGLTRKSVSEVDSIKNNRTEKKRKFVLKKSYAKKKEIEEIEKIDSGDWSEEKNKWQKIIDDNIKPKGA